MLILHAIIFEVLDGNTIIELQINDQGGLIVSNNNEELEKEPQKNNKKTMVIIEAVIALAAIGFIIFAIVKNKKDDSISGNALSQNSASSNMAVSGNMGIDPASVDNSVFYDMPVAPALSTFNAFTAEEASEKETSGELIKLALNDTENVYIPNFTDPDVYSEYYGVSQEEIDDFVTLQFKCMYLAEPDESKTVCEKYDEVDINFVGTLDGVEFEGGSMDNCSLLLGSQTMIPGFEEGIIGMKVGEEKDITVTFPSNYGSANLAGKEAVFKITLNDITGVPTNLTDEYVQAITSGGLTSVEECEEYAKQSIQGEKIYSSLTGYCFFDSDVAIAPENIEEYYNMNIDFSVQSVVMQTGYDLASFLTLQGYTVDDFKNDTVIASCQSYSYSIITQAILNYAGIDTTVTEEDINELAISAGYTDATELRNGYSEIQLNDAIYDQRAYDYLISLQ